MVFIERDIHYMQQALDLAQEAYLQGEVPIGALIVSPYNEIIGKGYNKTEQCHCQDQHAELCALRDACKHLSNWRLEGCTLYVTLEPCVMCMGCMVLSRIERLVYAAPSPLFGYANGKLGGCASYGDKLSNITTGTCRAEAEALLKDFFKQRRTATTERG